MKKYVLGFCSLILAGSLITTAFSQVSSTLDDTSGGDSNGCVNRPGSNNGHCVQSSGSTVTYTCANSSWYQSNDCVK